MGLALDQEAEFLICYIHQSDSGSVLGAVPEIRAQR